MCVCVYIYVCMCLCVYVYICIYVYMCVLFKTSNGFDNASILSVYIKISLSA